MVRLLVKYAGLGLEVFLDVLDWSSEFQFVFGCRPKGLEIKNSSSIFCSIWTKLTLHYSANFVILGAI